MSYPKHTREWWLREVSYIASAWSDDKQAFRGNESVFNEYVEMQAQHCEHNGFPELAFTMRGFKEFVPHSKRGDK